MFRRIIFLLVLVLSIGSLTGYAEGVTPGNLFNQTSNTVAASSSSESGVLKEDNLFLSMKNGVYTVFGSDIDRSTIKEIRFVNNLEETATEYWDVSAAGDNSVLAWVIDTTLYLASDGGVKAPVSCMYMFSLYRNLEDIFFNGSFDTSAVTDMTGMFSGCEYLREIDLNSLDVSKVQSMESMFEGCDRLRSFHAASWDISSLTNSTNIFNGCSNLGFDTLDGIWVEKYEVMEAEAAKTYRVLKVDDRGDDVAAMQKKLIELGYDSITKADGIFGARTAKAVHAFKKDHGVYDSGKHDAAACKATALMQQVLFSVDVSDSKDAEGESGQSDSEDETTPETVTGNISIPSDSAINAKDLKDNKLQLNFDISNETDHTIVSYTLSVYTSSVWGDLLYDPPITFDFDSAIDAHSTGKSGDIIVENRGQIANLYVGIKSATLDDGTVITYDDISYTHFAAVSWI